MRVTTLPIAQPSTDRLHVRLAQGAPAYSTAITFNNLGQGTLHGDSTNSNSVLIFIQ
jgi:hypothetical protein